MDNDLQTSDAQQENTLNPNLILTEWLMAVSQFQFNYMALTASLDHRTKETNRPGRLASQNPMARTDKLQALVITMQAELQELSLHMDQLSRLKGPGWSVLAAHTLSLNRLNQLARTHLQPLKMVQL